MVYLRRIFHPVGQGAFFSEQFCDLETDKVLYNVVYDCGTLSKGMKNQMMSEIKSCFDDKKEIDILFLSHFDNDHVNYVKYLEGNGFLQGARVIIPMLAAEEWLGIDPYVSNYQFVLSLRGSKNIKVIQVSFDEGGDDLQYRNDPISIERIEGDVIKSGTPLMHNTGSPGVVWCYTPFNIQFSTLIADFKKKLSDKELEYDKLKDGSYVEEHRGELKRIYQRLGKKPKVGTAINLNSLLVMSYPMDSKHCFWGHYHHRCRYRYRYLPYSPCCRPTGYSGSCLYTGDTSANDPLVWNRIEHMITQCLGPDAILSLLQVPHHGSKNSYDKMLLDSSRYYDGFANFDPNYRQRIFDELLPYKFSIKKRLLLLITKDLDSQYEEYWVLE